MQDDEGVDPVAPSTAPAVVADSATLEAAAATDAPEDSAPSVEAPPVQGAPPESAPLELDRMSFSGTGPEYFRIWIVNLALTIATLGIYSAWAKVRRLQFFYRHTRLAGAGFDYHGDPIALL